ncbi:hypothetical protein ES708_29118 [subsurface metagenome]
MVRSTRNALASAASLPESRTMVLKIAVRFFLSSSVSSAAWSLGPRAAMSPPGSLPGALPVMPSNSFLSSTRASNPRTPSFRHSVQAIRMMFAELISLGSFHFPCALAKNGCRFDATPKAGTENASEPSFRTNAARPRQVASKYWPSSSL